MDGSLTVMLVGLDAATADEFSDDERFDVRSVDTLDELPTDRSIDAVVIAMDGRGPLGSWDRCAARRPRPPSWS